MAVIGILLSLALLMFMAYKGFSVIVFAPIFAIMAAIFSGNGDYANLYGNILT